MTSLVAHDMKDGPKNFALQYVQSVDLIDSGRNVRADAAVFRKQEINELARLALHANFMGLKPVLGDLVYHGANVGCVVERVADVQSLDRTD